MKVNNINYRTVWMKDGEVFLIEQNLLPFEFKIYKSENYIQTCNAIINMTVRGAGAIGAAAGYAMAQAARESKKNNYESFLKEARFHIEHTRPTARNLFYAVEKVYNAALISVNNAFKEAEKIADKDAFDSEKIGEYGNRLISQKMNILTHCNAGWLAFVNYGTALSPIYKAHHEGKQITVYVDETRPRSQGARLTAWELNNENIPHKIIPDNAGAYLMSLGKIDMVIVGADRIAINGDVANKIGTLEKAIAAKTFNIPFYVAAPTSTIEFSCLSGDEINIEYRSCDEIKFQSGPDKNGNIHKIQVTSPGSDCLNPSFDITPAKFITGIITENGIINANKKDIESLKNN
ncbi:MAG: S-methyl-5-thioribose-1-phosphate isomerase [Chlorobi bacterium]|nr:S-methyl-5-thioribose-1-phosphate isomerase [Chlorobiota bacterium]